MAGEGVLTSRDLEHTRLRLRSVVEEQVLRHGQSFADGFKLVLVGKVEAASSLPQRKSSSSDSSESASAGSSGLASSVFDGASSCSSRMDKRGATPFVRQRSIIASGGGGDEVKINDAVVIE